MTSAQASGGGSGSLAGAFRWCRSGRVPLAHQRECDGPAEGLGGARYAHAVLGPQGQIALQVTDPEGVYLPAPGHAARWR